MAVTDGIHMSAITLSVNGTTHRLDVDPTTPLAVRAERRSADDPCDQAIRREDGMKPLMTPDARLALAQAGFSRRRFLKGAGALIVAFRVGDAFELAESAFAQGFNGTGTPPARCITESNTPHRTANAEVAGTAYLDPHTQGCRGNST
jgi:hypothetical protein